MKVRIYRNENTIPILAGVVLVVVAFFSLASSIIAEDAVGFDVPQPDVLKSQIRQAFERVDSVCYTKTLSGYKTNPDSGGLFQFTAERHSVVVMGGRYRTFAKCYSRAMVGEQCQFYQQESIFLPAESKDLLFKQSGYFEIPNTVPFDISLLSGERHKSATLSTQAILGTRGGHPLVEVPFLNGRFLTFEGRNIVGLMDDEMQIKNTKYEGLNCLEVKITRSNLSGIFVFCPQFNYAILKWKIEKFDDEEQTVVLKSTINDISAGMTEFEIEESYELLDKQGARQDYQETHASLRDFRTTVDASELDRVHQIPEGSEVSIVGMPQIQAHWKGNEVVRTFDEQVVEAASTARLVSRNAPQKDDWNTLGIGLLGIGMLVAVALFNFWPFKDGKGN